MFCKSKPSLSQYFLPGIMKTQTSKLSTVNFYGEYIDDLANYASNQWADELTSSVKRADGKCCGNFTGLHFTSC